jgi:hypothetical protein
MCFSCEDFNSSIMCAYFSKHLCVIIIIIIIIIIIVDVIPHIFPDEGILSRHYFKHRLDPLPLRSIALIPSEVVSLFVLMEFYNLLIHSQILALCILI